MIERQIYTKAPVLKIGFYQTNEIEEAHGKTFEVSLISHFGISRITLQLYHTKIKILI
jgi:hypothetical protein